MAQPRSVVEINLAEFGPSLVEFGLAKQSFHALGL